MKESTELTTAEAQKLSKFSRQQLYNLVRDGAIKSRKIGWQHFIDRRSLETYIATASRASRGQQRAGR